MFQKIRFAFETEIKAGIKVCGIKTSYGMSVKNCRMKTEAYLNTHVDSA